MTGSTSRILVLGATGYVGGRLVPELLRGEAPVRCMSRSLDGLRSLPFHTGAELVEGDLFDPASLARAFEDVHTVVYLVHSLGSPDFEERELECARHTCAAAQEAGVEHIVYLSGLGDDDDRLSPHLRSRHAVGAALASGTAAVTELRAAVVLGAGSASFEMLRHLVDVLPVMLAPRWVTRTRLQPIAVADVLGYLTAAVRSALTEGERTDHHRIVEIGGPDAMTYAELMQEYARVAGLRRLVVPVPVLSPGLSAHWVGLITPLPRRLASSLIDSLKNDVVVTDDSASSLSPHTTMSTARAIESALSAIEDLDIPTRWSGVTPRLDAARPKPWDPDWSGGKVYADRRVRTVDASPEVFQATVRGIGGERGWFGFRPLWAVRGYVDALVGGVGLRRGRRHPDEINVGEAIDFWRVEVVDDDLFRLRAEMRLPGVAWLEWATSPADGGRAVVEQRARFVPNGLLGRAYWVVLVPFHVAIFPVMLRRIARAAEAATTGGRHTP